MPSNKVTIDQLGLSMRSSNALHRHGIFMVDELLEYDAEHLSQIKNLGQKSIAEILERLDAYKKEAESGRNILGQNAQIEVSESQLQEFNIPIGDVVGLSAKAYNLLILSGYSRISQVAFATTDELLSIPGMDITLVDAIKAQINRYLSVYCKEASDQTAPQAEDGEIPIEEWAAMPKNRSIVQQFFQYNDAPISTLGLSTRLYNRLMSAGYTLISQFVFLSEKELRDLHQIGEHSLKDAQTIIAKFWKQNEYRLRAFAQNYGKPVYFDEDITENIIHLYDAQPFAGLSFSDFKEKLHLDPSFPDERLKKIIGKLLADKKLEYVDFRCYRIYPSFCAGIDQCPDIRQREKDILHQRLNGETLEAISKKYDLTRERIRQIGQKAAVKAKNWLLNSDQVSFLDEDYYSYFYSHYDFDKKETTEWLGIPTTVWNYFDILKIKQGTKSINTAMDDTANLSVSLRLKIKNYINRNKVLVDGEWVEKKRPALEKIVIKKLCRDDTAFEDFEQIYNDFLRSLDIPYDDKLYYTKKVLRARVNHISENHDVLWKHGGIFRYYDMDSRDYTELWDTLNLDSYENIFLSTAKFMNAYPAIMKQYDIRSANELHNLMRKKLPAGSFHDFACERMPHIRFGQSNIDDLIMNLMIDHAPIHAADLADLVHQETGIEPELIMSAYLIHFNAYCHQSVYRIDQKIMSVKNKEILQEALTDNFYFMDEIRRIYKECIPDADIAEINAYNLKSMGFLVFSTYVIQNYSTADEYFRHLLTEKEMTDITPYRKRFGYVQAFSQALLDMKKERTIVEFEHNQIILLSKLQKAGVTKEMLEEFCDDVYDVVADGSYFTAASLYQDGMESPLDDLGFSDWFYSEILLPDERFSHTMAFGTYVFYKGSRNIMLSSFVASLVETAGSIDIYDLISELTQRYGCHIADKSDLPYKLSNTTVYYDRVLERFYANEELYYRELDETEAVL